MATSDLTKNPNSPAAAPAPAPAPVASKMVRVKRDKARRRTRNPRPAAPASPKGLGRFVARSRPAVFWSGFAITLMGYGLMFVHPLVASLSLCAAILLLFRPAVAMVIAGALTAIFTAANPVVFGQTDEPALIQLPLLGLSMAVLAYLVIKQNLRPRRVSYVFAGCVILGGLVTLVTTTSFGTSLDALWKFALPLAPLVMWFENRRRRVCAAKDAPYAFSGMMAGVVVSSLIVLALGAGRELNLTDFQGVFWHPQTLGMMMAAAAPPVLYAKRLPIWLRGILLGAIVTLAWLSWTRTALAALSIAGLFVAGIWLSNRLRIRLGPRFKRPVMIGQGLVIVALALASLVYASGLAPQTYVIGETSQEILSQDAYANARTFALYRAYQNFADHALTGIGFGVPSDARLLDPDFEAQVAAAFRDGQGSEVLFDKGNSYLAIFEETGLLGAWIWLGLLTYLMVQLCSTGRAATTMAIVFCLSLFAEATAFSLGGVGMVLWSSLFACAGLGGSRAGSSQQAGQGKVKGSDTARRQARIERERQLHARGFERVRVDSLTTVQTPQGQEQDLEVKPQADPADVK
ncbi:MAG: hypothetical protein RLZZ157_221 [Pseudomonadota bacterium]